MRTAFLDLTAILRVETRIHTTSSRLADDPIGEPANHRSRNICNLEEKNDKKSRSLGYRPDVEGLRAVAILLVVLYHARVPGFTGGFIGVDVFFVVSGYLITGLLSNEYANNGKIRLAEFYARRSRRLLPAISLLVVATVIAGYLLLAPVEQVVIARTAVATSAYLSNVFFARNAVDYLAEVAEHNPLLHTWSLAVEEQYYLAFPISLVLLFFIASKLGKRKQGILTLLAFGGVTVLSLAVSILLTKYRQPWAFFLPPARAWEFAIGGLGYLVPVYLGKGSGSYAGDLESEGQNGRMNWRSAIGWLSIVVLLIVTYVFGRETEFPGYVATVPALATLGILIGDYGQKLSVNRILGLKPLQFVGKLSYSWYLWHWFILVFTDSLFQREFHYPVRSLAVALSLLPAYASYRLVENPIRFSKFLKPRPAYSIAMALALTVGCVAFAAGWNYRARSAAASPLQVRFSRAADDLPSIYASNCHNTFSMVVAESCTFGSEEAPYSVVLVGDSHAAQWFPALEKIAADKGWKLTVFTKPSCPPIDAIHFSEYLGRDYWECGKWRKSVIDQLRPENPDLVVATGAATYDLTDEEWRKGVRVGMEELKAVAKQVVWVADTPRLDFNIPFCLASYEWRKGWLPNFNTCEFDLEDTTRPKIRALQEEMVSKLEGVTMVDLTDRICERSPCSPYRDGYILYRDSHHLTASFVASLASEFGARIDRLSAAEQP